MLTCAPSDHARDYEILVGTDPVRIQDYTVWATTSEPPNHLITDLPSDPSWWAIRVRNAQGAAMVSEPQILSTTGMIWPVENLRSGTRFARIQEELDTAGSGDEILVGPGWYYENLCFSNKALTLRSHDPDDSQVIANTVICSARSRATVTFDSVPLKTCTLQGVTITGQGSGIACRNSAPNLDRCTIIANRSHGVFVTGSHVPVLTDCTIAENGGYGVYHRITTEEQPETLTLLRSIVAGNRLLDPEGGLSPAVPQGSLGSDRRLMGKGRSQ